METGVAEVSLDPLAALEVEEAAVALEQVSLELAGESNFAVSKWKMILRILQVF